MNKKKLSRRDFLNLAGAASAGLALSACGASVTENPAPTATITPVSPTKTPLPTPTPTPAPTPMPETLRAYASALGLRLGTVIEGVGGPENETRDRLIAEHFNEIAITTIDWSVTRQGGPNSFDFSIPDSKRKYARDNNLDAIGMALVYGVDLPDWLKNGGFSRDELIDLLKRHVRVTVEHNKGLMRAYTVANEATEPSLFWNRRIGKDYVEIAFQTAREADPEAILIYNDFGHETALRPKAKRIYELVRALKEKDLIDMAGIQMHIIGGDNLEPRTPPTKDQLLEQIARYGELGLKVILTEVTVDTGRLPGTREEKFTQQADIYRTLVEACLESSGICDDLIVWGFNDDETFGGRDGLLFSLNKPKPAYFAILDTLKKYHAIIR